MKHCLCHLRLPIIRGEFSVKQLNMNKSVNLEKKSPKIKLTTTDFFHLVDGFGALWTLGRHLRWDSLSVYRWILQANFWPFEIFGRKKKCTNFENFNFHEFRQDKFLSTCSPNSQHSKTTLELCPTANIAVVSNHRICSWRSWQFEEIWKQTGFWIICLRLPLTWGEPANENQSTLDVRSPDFIVSADANPAGTRNRYPALRRLKTFDDVSQKVLSFVCRQRWVRQAPLHEPHCGPQHPPVRPADSPEKQSSRTNLDALCLSRRPKAILHLFFLARKTSFTKRCSTKPALRLAWHQLAGCWVTLWDCELIARDFQC